jgi:aldehyde:ferredoxin oxidoreductase
MDDVGKIGKKIINMEQTFNKAAGFTEAHDRLPEFMRHESLPPHNVVWVVPDEQLDKVLG